VALGLLSVELPARVALDLLEDALGEETAALLEQIPASVNLWDADAGKLIEKGGPADTLWRLPNAPARITSRAYCASRVSGCPWP
jgi:hypothetical protein